MSAIAANHKTAEDSAPCEPRTGRFASSSSFKQRRRRSCAAFATEGGQGRVTSDRGEIDAVLAQWGWPGSVRIGHRWKLQRRRGNRIDYRKRLGAGRWARRPLRGRVGLRHDGPVSEDRNAARTFWQRAVTAPCNHPSIKNARGRCLGPRCHAQRSLACGMHNFPFRMLGVDERRGRCTLHPDVQCYRIRGRTEEALARAVVIFLVSPNTEDKQQMGMPADSSSVHLGQGWVAVVLTLRKQRWYVSVRQLRFWLHWHGCICCQSVSEKNNNLNWSDCTSSRHTTYIQYINMMLCGVSNILYNIYNMCVKKRLHIYSIWTICKKAVFMGNRLKTLKQIILNDI